eukprot:s1411_g7.t1
MKTLPGVKPFAYMDDRSLTDSGASLPRALQLTAWSDQRLGLVEHTGKRQEWCRADPQARSVEHLGLFLQHGLPVVPKGRACSELLCDLACTVGGLPGCMETREQLLLSLVLPVGSPIVSGLPQFLFLVVQRQGVG